MKTAIVMESAVWPPVRPAAMEAIMDLLGLVETSIIWTREPAAAEKENVTVRFSAEVKKPVLSDGSKPGDEKIVFGLPLEWLFLDEAAVVDQLKPFLEKWRSLPRPEMTCRWLWFGPRDPDREVVGNLPSRIPLVRSVGLSIASNGRRVLSLTAKQPEDEEKWRRTADEVLTETLGPTLLPFRSGGVETAIIRAALAKRWSLATAESCTGGLAAARLVSVPGASDVFRGGVTAYHNDLKRDLVGVPEDILASTGAVSPQTAAAMAKEIRHRLKVTAALAVTGVAGPGGGSSSKPVGLVYSAIASPEGTQIERDHFTGSRDTIRAKSAQKGLEMLLTTMEHSS